jgi:hypothetical protein
MVNQPLVSDGGKGEFTVNGLEFRPERCGRPLCLPDHAFIKGSGGIGKQPNKS